MDRIDELTQACFNTIIDMRRLGEASRVDPQRLHKHARLQVEQMIAQAGKLGVAHDDAREMAYAIVALMDELALKAPPEISQPWMSHLLQRQLFGENVAGEGFFDHLERARSAQRVDVLRVYYTCLALGFMGRYAMRGQEYEIEDIMGSVRTVLQQTGAIGDVETLAPRGDPPAEAITKPEARFRLLWVPAAAVGVAVTLYIVFATLVAGDAVDFNAYLESVLR